MSRIIYPPTYISRINGPLIFLAGPIQGAADWQAEAIKIVHALDPQINIACPRRQIKFEGEFKKSIYNEQVDWETFYLNMAGKEKGRDGAIIFWMAKEFEHRCDRAYAQTTRGEFFEWKTKHEWFGAQLAVGIEDGYTGVRYIMRRIEQDCPDIKIYSTLEDTCRQAVELVTSKKYF